MPLHQKRFFPVFIGMLFLFSSVPVDAHVTLRTKLKDSIYNPGDQVNIEWEVLVEHDPIDWDLFYSFDGGKSWEPIEEGIPLDQLKYTWIAPDLDSDSMLIRIVQDNEVTEDYDEVSDTFSIVPARSTAISEKIEVPFSATLVSNPVDRELFAKLKINKKTLVSMRIVSMMGYSMWPVEKKLLSRGDHHYRVDVLYLTPGPYFLQIIADHKARLLPFIVAR